MTLLFFAKFLSWYGDSGSARNSSMPRETATAPATLPLCCTSGGSRTSTTSVLPLAIISRACAGVIRGTAALAASSICLTLVDMASSFPRIRNCASRPRARAIGCTRIETDLLPACPALDCGHKPRGAGDQHERTRHVAKTTLAFGNPWPPCRRRILRRTRRRYQAAERLSAMVPCQYHDHRQRKSAVRRSRRNAQRLRQFDRTRGAQEGRTLSR